MPLVVINGIRLFFAHVPKTGGSSVSDYLTRRGETPLAVNDGGFPGAHRQRDTIVSPQHMTARTVATLLPCDIDHSFAVVRDPLSRILSQFRFQAGHSRISRLGFSTWLRIVVHAARRDPRIYDNHIRPQTDMVPAGAVVFRLENGFTDMISWLDDVTRTTRPDIEMDHLLKRRTDPVTVLKQDAALITDFYRADYERFGYDMPSPDTYATDPAAAWRSTLGAATAYPLVNAQRRKWLK